MNPDTIVNKQDIDLVYKARKNRIVYPKGRSDNGGRWYPSDAENCDNYTVAIRSPTRSWPLSYQQAARTRKHVYNIAHMNPEFFAELVIECKCKIIE